MEDIMRAAKAAGISEEDQKALKEQLFEVLKQKERDYLMKLADDIGGKIERGELPPQNEFGQYILP